MLLFPEAWLIFQYLFEKSFRIWFDRLRAIEILESLMQLIQLVLHIHALLSKSMFTHRTLGRMLLLMLELYQELIDLSYYLLATKRLILLLHLDDNMFNHRLQQILNITSELLELKVAFEDIRALIDYDYYPTQLKPNITHIADRVPIGWAIDTIPHADAELLQNQRQAIDAVLSCDNLSIAGNTILFFLPTEYILRDLSGHYENVFNFTLLLLLSAPTIYWVMQEAIKSITVHCLRWPQLRVASCCLTVICSFIHLFNDLFELVKLWECSISWKFFIT